MSEAAGLQPSANELRSVNAFRRRRGRLLAALIQELAAASGRPLHILDIGGKHVYWRNLELANVAKITIQNLNPRDVERSRAQAAAETLFDFEVGDATDLRDYGDRSVDLIHSNSVLEHVGGWPRMRRMAEEVRRVGRAGWIQTPAWEFPLEVHSRLPFVHWFGNPLWTSALVLRRRWRRESYHRRRAYVDDINMVTHRELGELFPGDDVYVERFLLLPKSYVVRWSPAGVAPR